MQILQYITLTRQHILEFTRIVGKRNRFVPLRKVKYADNFLPVRIPSDSQQPVVTGVRCPYICRRSKRRCISTQSYHCMQPAKYFSLRCFRIMHMLRILPSEPAPVQIAAVIRFFRIVLIAVVIDLSQFISTVQHRNARLHQHHGMQCQIKPYRPFHCRLILFEPCLFNAAQACRSSAESCIAAGNIIIV